MVKDSDRRPDPDELLARVNEAESRGRRGKLHLFFGAAPGVGKTYTMLEAARGRRAEGVDVVAGWVVTHGRAETEALLEGFESLPPLLLSYRGKELREFDLDAALERKPALLLVDELAHTNAPGSRHAKRWQDVRELIEAGIDVYSTLNVQHIESLNDVVAQITGVTVRERVPDSVLAGADEVEIVDLPPEELLQRLREGKVYLPEEAQRAAENFFRPGNLLALRELALRKTAERVDLQMQRYRDEHAVRDTWPAGERVLVCLGPSPYGQRLVRAARLLATQLRAEWIALYVETPAHARLAPADREQLHRTMRLAEQLGGEVVSIAGNDTAEELLHYARSRNVTKIVLGRPPRPGAPWKKSLVDRVIRGCGGIDIHVIGGAAEERLARIREARKRPRPLRPYLLALGVVALCGLASAAMRPFIGPVNLVMVFLLGVVIVATRWGAGPAVMASVLGVAVFDVFFIPPYMSFAVHDTQYLITFAVMLVVALVIANLAARVRMQAERARERERQTTTLYRLAQELSRERDLSGVARAVVSHLQDHYALPSAVLLPDGAGGLAVAADTGAGAGRRGDASVAKWVLDRGRPAGRGTDTLPGSGALYLPLDASGGRAGVLAVETEESLPPEQRQLLETIAGQAAMALERAQLADAARRSQMEVETERMRSALLSSVSHDLRTPLATVVGASSALLTGPLDEKEKRELTQSIFEESERLSRYVHNLLDMTRLEAGSLTPDRQWQPLEEVVGAALDHLQGPLTGREVRIALPEALPMVSVDARLMEQVLVNLLENAAHYTPPESPIEISASAESGGVQLRVEDRGPGLKAGSEKEIFEKFHRGTTRSEGAGLGLAICHAIVTLHGGTIRAENRPGGGARFTIALPHGDLPPPDDPVEPHGEGGVP